MNPASWFPLDSWASGSRNLAFAFSCMSVRVHLCNGSTNLSPDGGRANVTLRVDGIEGPMYLICDPRDGGG